MRNFPMPPTPTFFTCDRLDERIERQAVHPHGPIVAVPLHVLPGIVAVVAQALQPAAPELIARNHGPQNFRSRKTSSSRRRGRTLVLPWGGSLIPGEVLSPCLLALRERNIGVVIIGFLPFPTG